MRPFIRRVLLEQRGKDDETLRRAMREVYPFPSRSGWKYRVWLQKIDIQQDLFRKWEQWELDNGNVDDTAIVAWLKG